MRKITALLLSVLLLCSNLPSAYAEDAPAERNALSDATLQQVQTAISGATNWYGAYDQVFSYWDVITLHAASANDARADALTADTAWTIRAYQLIEDSDYTGLSLHLLSMLSSGKNPDSVRGILPRTSPVEALAASQTENGALGTYGALTDTIYAVIAMESTRPTAYDRIAAKKYILSQQCPDGGFAIYGKIGDVDVTGMTLLALSFFRGEPDADASMGKAEDYLYRSLTENGGYISTWSASGAENSNSLSAALSGLFAADAKRLITSDVYPLMVNNLLSYTVDDGGFSYEVTDTLSNYLATYQALLALSDVYNGEVSWVHRLAWKTNKTTALARYPDRSDLSTWAEGYVASATLVGLLQGNNNGFLNPKGRMTRAEFSTILCRIAGSNINANNIYGDVWSGAWYAKDILSAAKSGYIVSTNGNLRPNAYVTRSEAAYAITVLCSLNKSNGSVEAVKKAGIMMGDPDGDFRASDYIRREEAAKILLLASTMWSVK